MEFAWGVVSVTSHGPKRANISATAKMPPPQRPMGCWINLFHAEIGRSSGASDIGLNAGDYFDRSDTVYKASRT